MVEKNNLKQIKGFLRILPAIPLAGVAIQQVGATPSIPSGIREVTQIGVAGGLLGLAVKPITNKKKGGFL
ncbi:hypothetical protein LCGC14_0374490 [marine sediment metagenome]|uniref:Uncharacterized protein n=1 Tax=marine sediment metagenome TaxID=412755 RepID=A0A0F9TA24_9ZZZZ